MVDKASMGYQEGYRRLFWMVLMIRRGRVRAEDLEMKETGSW